MNRIVSIFLSATLIACLTPFASCSEDTRSDNPIQPDMPYVREKGVDYLEILAVGDAGTGEIGQKTTAAALRQYASATQIDFVISLGDNFYSKGVASTKDPLWDSNFESIYDPSTLYMPFYAILGNHDYRGNIQAQIDYVSPNSDRWQMPNRYYRIDRTLKDNTAVDFFFLDTEKIIEGDAAQLSWLEEELKNSQANWKVVSGHHPLFSHGNHGSNETMIASVRHILDHRADLYLSGHEHDIQIMEAQNGVYYIVNGSAAKIRDTTIGKNTLFAVSTLGFMSFLFSWRDMVCEVFDSNSGLIFSSVLKTR